MKREDIMYAGLKFTIYAYVCVVVVLPVYSIFCDAARALEALAK